MDSEIAIEYFGGSNVNKYVFGKYPKNIIKNEYFSELSIAAKLLYILMIERASVSLKNNWFDEQKRVYIYFTIENIMKELNVGKNKAVKTIAELDRVGLIEKKKQKLGKPDKIYVRIYFFKNDQLRRGYAVMGNCAEEKQIPGGDYMSDFKKPKKVDKFKNFEEREYDYKELEERYAKN
ncbi:Replication initiator protein A (RepA) N-terminus [Lachnospiraceae bacterium]|nr:Replication initiator protein A (RepA) N-terminus [Lachnospiraceae bacterium]